MTSLQTKSSFPQRRESRKCDQNRSDDFIPIDKFTWVHYPEDKRTLRICLSDKGISLKPRLTTERDQANQECLDGLTMEEKVLLKRLLRDVSYTK